jgi:hypothetical protein
VYSLDERVESEAGSLNRQHVAGVRCRTQTKGLRGGIGDRIEDWIEDRLGLAFQVAVDPFFDFLAAVVDGIEAQSERFAFAPSHDGSYRHARQREQ